MMLQNEKCFFYPVTVMIVDDNEIFLENLPHNLSDNASYKLFATPFEAMDFLERYKDVFPKSEDFLGEMDDFLTGTSLNVNIRKIPKFLYNPERFKAPAIIIVDQDMPGMTGIEFCKKLKHLPLKVILLTGVADDKTAIEAFNEGIIHKFIHKNDSDVFNTIDFAVKDLQEEFFTEISQPLIKLIKNVTCSLLDDACRSELISQIILKNKICEYYLTDPRGSLLLLNGEGEMIWLVIQSEEEISICCQLAKDNNAPDEIVESLSSRQKLLCLFSEEDFKQPVQKWSEYLYSANPFKDIYYTVIGKELAFKATGIEKDKIFSYREFRLG